MYLICTINYLHLIFSKITASSISTWVYFKVALGLLCEVSNKRQKLNGLFWKSAQKVLSLNSCEERTEICICVMADRFCSLNQSTCNVKINGANFSHLQPMAELRRNQRGEIGRQHVKAHSCSHFSPCFDHTSPTQTDDSTSQLDHDIGAYVPYSFRTMSRVLLRHLPTEVQGWRRQGQRLNVTAQWRDHLNWERLTASMISPVS